VVLLNKAFLNFKRYKNNDKCCRQKKTEGNFKSSEGKFNAIFEDASDAYFLYNLKGRFIDGNKAAEGLIGYRKEDPRIRRKIKQIWRKIMIINLKYGEGMMG